MLRERALKIMTKLLTSVFSLAAVFLCLPSLAARAQETKRNVKLITKETSFGKRYRIIAEYNNHLVFSPDGNRLAYWAWTLPPSEPDAPYKRDYVRIVVNGVPGKAYDYTDADTPHDSSHPPGTPIFSPDSKHLAYRALREAQWMVVRDGKEGPLFKEKQEDLYENNGADVIDDILFSPDSQHLAYRARRNGKWRVVVDGKEGKAYDWISDNDLHFSADSKRVAYGAERGGKYFIVTRDERGVKEAPYGSASATDARMVRLLERGNKQMVVIDGRLGPAYDEIGQDEFRYKTPFSPDRKRVAYAARRGKKWMVVVDGREGKAYDGIDDLLFSPNSKHFSYIAYSAAKGGQSFVVRDGLESKPFDNSILSPIFSPDSQHLAYILRGEGDAVVRDGQQEQTYAVVEDLRFSPDSAHLLYHANKVVGKQFMPLVVRDDKEYPRSTIWSSDGAHTASLVERDGKTLAVSDGQEGHPFDDVYGLTFDPDGGHLAYWAKHDNHWFIVIDGVEGKAYVDGPGPDQWHNPSDYDTPRPTHRLEPLVFLDAKTLQTLALRSENEIVRVRIKIVEE